MKQRLLVLLPVLVILAGAAGYLIHRRFFSGSLRDRQVIAFLRQPAKYPEWIVPELSRCGNAPFFMPTRGFIGYLWDDSFYPGHRHQGIDIFAGTSPGQTPVYAAYDGYLSRQADWKSSLIQRVPVDPLQPSRQIWLYYTHLADAQGNSLIDAQFPPGISERYISAGTLLGYQGNYSGAPGKPVGVHLHFSIVLDDGGKYRNELDIQNTLDPSPYLGLPLNALNHRDRIPLCETR